MRSDAIFRALLICDLLIEGGRIPPATVAGALESALRRPEDGVDVAALASKDHDVDPTTIHAAVDALCEVAGSVESAFEARGPARVASLGPFAGPNTRRALLEVGANVETALRPMAEGRYQDFAPVGKGGMGIVYWALDAELNREVAVKVINPARGGAGTDITPISPDGVAWPKNDTADADRRARQLEARFLQEAWITGSMTHPGIVPVYELGRTDAGVPYYTMRFVEGRRTLADAIDDVRGKPLEARLLLLDAFLSVCDTIRYAHSHGVLHRDLKPSNVVLGEYGEIVVVDWGLARVRDRPDGARGMFLERIQELRDATDLRTVADAAGTPGYMAPEAAGGDVDAVSEQGDVYSLATVLFEILTGRLPIPVHDLRQYLRDATAGSVPRASELDPAVPKALDDLCARGLATTPADRVESVEALADAVRTWRRQAATERERASLRREAESALGAARVAIGPATLPQLERASHAARRMLDLEHGDAEATRLLAQVDELRTSHVTQLERDARRLLLKRVGVAAVAVTAIAAVIVALVLEKRRQDAADARASAAASQERAEDVMTFMVGDLLNDLEPLGRLDLVTKVGARARAYYAKLPPQDASAESLENRALALRRLGEAFSRRGDLSEALAAHTTAHSTAVELERRGAEATGRFQRALADAAIGNVLFRQGYPTRAREVLETAQVALDGLSGADAGHHPEILDAQSEVDARLASILLTEGRWEAALELARRALEHARRATALDPGRRRTLLRRRLELADIEYGPDRQRVASDLRTVISELEALSDESPDDVRWVELEAEGRLRLSRVLHGLDEYEASAQQIALASKVLRGLVARDPSNLTWASTYASAERMAGDALVSLRQWPEAQELFRSAYDRMRALSASDPSNARWLNKLITLCDRLVLTGQELSGSPEEIDGWRKDAVRHARQLLERDPENAKHRHILAYTIHRRASRTIQAGDLKGGLAQTAESRALLEALLAENPDNEEAAVLLGWNTHVEMRALEDSGAWERAIELSARPAAVLANIVTRRPDLWQVRDVYVSTETERARSLIEEGDDADRIDAAALLDTVDQAIEVASDQELSELARMRFEERRAAVRALRDRIGSGG